MAINKVVYGNDVLIDLSNDTAEASDVAQGKTFHLKSGAQGTGTALGGTSIYDGYDSTGDLYNELFFGDVASGVDDVKVSFDMDLLWTNSSPSADFAPQTISLDLSEYKMVFIEYSSQIVAGLFVYSSDLYQKDGVTKQNGRGWHVNVMRTITVAESGIAFGEGYYFKTYNSYNGTTANSLLVPLKIYGIR